MLHKIDINSHIYTPKHYFKISAYSVVLLLHLFLGKIMNTQAENKRLLLPPNEKKIVHLDSTGGLKSSNCVLDALQISLKVDSPFSDLIRSNVLSRTSYPNPVRRR